MSLASRVAEHHLYAQPRSPRADARDFLDKRHGVGGWSYRTGVGLGTDIVPSLHDAFDAVRARYGRGEIILPPAETGMWRLAQGLNAAKLSGHRLEGLGSQATKVVFDANSGALFDLSGAGAFTGGGIKGIGVLLEEGYPTSTAEILKLSADATYAPDQTLFEDIYASAMGASYWYNGFNGSGILRTSPQGIRIAMARDIQIFRCRNAGGLFYNCVGWSLDNFGVFSGTGTGNDVYISGGGAANTNTTKLEIRGLTCSGALNLSNATKSALWGDAASVVAATSFNYHTGVVFAATLTGTLGPNGNLLVIP
jgi:hypothetical protein